MLREVERIAASAWWLAGVEEAQDGVQEVMLRLSEGKYDARFPFGAWVGVVLKRLQISRQRRQARWGEIEENLRAQLGRGVSHA